MGLRNNRIGDDGATALADALRPVPLDPPDESSGVVVPLLSHLDLQGNDVGLDGLIALGEMVEQHPLFSGKSGYMSLLEQQFPSTVSFRVDGGRVDVTERRERSKQHKHPRHTGAL